MVKLQFYPIDLDYKVIRGKAIVYIYGRTIDGKQIGLIDDSFEPYFYVLPKKEESFEEVRKKLKKIRVEKRGGDAVVERTEIVSKKIQGVETRVIQVIPDIPKSVPDLRRVIKHEEYVEEVFEYDILFTKRYLIDRQITPLVLTEADANLLPEHPKESRVPLFRLNSIKQYSSETYEEPKILAFDIETYNPLGKISLPEKFPIIMLSLYGKNMQKVITWKKFKTNLAYVEFVDGEAELLERFKELVDEYRPDILTGYYSDGFDFPYIIKRAEKYKIRLDLSFDYDLPQQGRGKNDAVDLSGIVHIDILNFIRRVVSRTLETDSLKLDCVAKELLGESKTEVDIERLAGVWDSNSDELEKFCEYNLTDSRLTYELCEKTMPNLVEFVKLIGQPLKEVNRMSFSQLVENYLIKRSPEFNLIIPNKPYTTEVGERREQRIKGAFVFEPRPGLYKDVVVFDFRSLYPTIITSHNISIETLNCECCRENEKEKVPYESKELWFCKNKQGFFSTVLKELITRRMRIKELMKNLEGKDADKKRILLNARQDSLKVIANSFYGYLRFFAARWYSQDCAASVTAYARHYIHKVINEAKKSGFTILYSDTDSVFIQLNDKTKDQALRFCDDINSNLPGLMELEYEGFYPRALFVAIKEADVGAKKKYALIDEKNSITIKGFETVRRNWSAIAKETQEEVIRIVLEEEKPKKAFEYVKKIIQDLRDKNMSTYKLIIHTQLTKPIETYESIGPHVAIAKKLRDKGAEIVPGMIISYVVTAGKELIRDRAKLPEEISGNNYDSEYYINHQIIPSVDRILEVFGYTKEDLSELKTQSKLGKYFE